MQKYLLSFIDADLSGADLSGADLSGADFTEVILDGVKSEGIIGLPSNLSSKYKVINGLIIDPNIDFSGLDLTNADLSGFNLSNKNLSGTILINAIFTNVKSTNITFDAQNPPTLSSNVKLVNGILFAPGVDLTGLDLTGLDLTGVDFTGVTTKNITFDAQNPPTLPPKYIVIQSYSAGKCIIGPGVKLRSLALYNLNLSNMDLTNMDLTGAQLRNLNFTNATLTNAIFTNAYFRGSMNFKGAKLKDVNFENVNSSQDIYSSRGFGINFTNAKFTNANFKGAKLKDLLSNMPFTNANLEDANFENTKLNSINFNGVTLTNANFENTKLNHINFNGVTLTNANFKGANFDTVIFNGANVEGATFTNITYSRVLGLAGKAIDGYVSFAFGGLFDINDTTNAIETFITDENGNYDLFTPISELPEVYVIIIQPGGTDITTGKIVTTTMSSTSTRKQAEASAVPILHVTPVTTIVTNIIQTINTVNEAIGETTDETTVSSAMEQVATKLNISVDSIRSDFIADQNSDVVKIVQQIETTVNSMTSALNNTEITGDVVTNNISLVFMEPDTTFDFSNSDDIDKIITNIENSNTILDDVFTIPESDTTNEDINNIIANTLEDGAETITIDESVKSNTSNFITVANTLISDIDTATQTFDDVFTRATQITVASTEIATTNRENFTSPVEVPTISEITSVPITIPAPSFITNICFPGNTPIETDDGYITIKKLVPGHHTIRGQRIVGITKTIAPDEHLICFEKDALGKNVPSQRTLMSKEHKIYYKNKLQEARHFLEDFDLVSKSKYSGEPLYNVLLEYHGVMIVNNMPCETLHPKSLSAKLYTSIRYSSSVREQILATIHRAIQNKDYKTYRKIMKRI
jgi:uncharacterized protein YjbI with pentapeptide repeats